MRPRIKIMVMDAAPLIYLAAGKSLDFLLYAGAPGTGARCRLPRGDGRVRQARRAGHHRLVSRERRCSPCRTHCDLSTRNEGVEALGGRLPRDVGERAALELVRAYPFVDEERALLLSNDRDAERLSIVDPARLVLIGTWDFLLQLEAARRIQSAEAVRAAVLGAGITMPTRDLFSRHDPDIQEAVREILKRASG